MGLISDMCTVVADATTTVKVQTLRILTLEATLASVIAVIQAKAPEHDVDGMLGYAKSVLDYRNA